ncbi:MAG: recombinase family protein [Oscillospiraceae bacterium]|nr:recombinase family protein [Oscillospiraceae bacterium]
MNAVIYARYSSDHQREESIEGQLRECREFAMKNNLCVIGEYIDRAYSAKTDNRPDFQKMIKDSSSKKFNVVIVWKLDRFARNRYDSAYYKNILKKNMVEVISATEVISKGPDGIMIESLLEGYAEYYSAELSVKVIRGMTENALKCKYNGGSVPIGYYIDKNNQYQIDVITAPYVKDAFVMYASNFSMKEIAEYLKDKGVRTGRNKIISLRSMSTIFRNRKYIGEYKYRDIVIPDGIPQIVPLELFDEVQKKLDMKRRNSNPDMKKRYILSSKLRCGKCNSLMCGESGTSKTGKVYHYYKCSSVKRHLGCDMKSVRQEDIEKEVLEYVVHNYLTKENMEIIVQQIMEINKKENAGILLLKKQYTCVERNIRNIVDAIADGFYNDSVKDKLLNLEKEKANLEMQIEIEKEKVSKLTLTEEQIRYWYSNILTLLPDSKKSILVDTFIDEIVYFDDKND